MELRKGVGITSSGGFASRWADQSGHGNDAIQNTATNQPALQASGSLLFDGVDNFMSCALTSPQPVQFYLKGKQVTWTLDRRIVGASGSNKCNLYQAVSTPKIGASSDNVNFLPSSSSDWLVNTTGVVAWCFDGANSSLQVDNNAAITGDAGTQDLLAFRLGAGSNPAVTSNIELEHFLVFSGNHSDVAKAKLITYLLSLP
jgi:hypothetical protein